MRPTSPPPSEAHSLAPGPEVSKCLCPRKHPAREPVFAGTAMVGWERTGTGRGIGVAFYESRHTATELGGKECRGFYMRDWLEGRVSALTAGNWLLS